MEFFARVSKTHEGAAYMVKFDDNARWVGQHGGNAEGVIVTITNLQGVVIGDATITVADLLKVARAVKI